jgi:hypothetical protein
VQQVVDPSTEQRSKDEPPPIKDGDPVEATAQAFLGFATLDLKEWQEKLIFGTWVVRRVDDAQVDGLCKDFETKGLMAFLKEAQLILLVPTRSVVNRGELWLALKDNLRPPVIRFTTETQVLPAAGGQHRMAALAKYTKGKLDDVNNLQEQVNAHPDDPDLAGALQRAQVLLDETRWWGVEIYDEGQSVRISIGSPSRHSRLVNSESTRQQRRSGTLLVKEPCAAYIRPDTRGTIQRQAPRPPTPFPADWPHDVCPPAML